MFGNQVSYTADGVVYTNYTYRPDGLRHSIDDKVHVWDGANIVADIDGSNVSVYIRGINLIYADDGDKTYYHFNAHGDVVVLTNESGNKTKSYSYNAFGVEYNEATLDDNPFRYCGEYYDKETQTIYLRARYYNPAQGRFTQEDPLRDGYNWYAYCGGNPIMFVDPTGHAEKTINKHSFNDGGVGGGGEIVFVAIEYSIQLAEKIDQGLTAWENSLASLWNSFVDFFVANTDNMVRIFLDGAESVKQTYHRVIDWFNDTNSPKGPDDWNHRDYYLNLADDPELHEIINQLYRPNAHIGDGGTADKLIYEYQNGLELKHLTKAYEKITQLQKILKTGRLSESDTKLAYKLLNDLYTAVKLVTGK